MVSFATERFYQALKAKLPRRDVTVTYMRKGFETLMQEYPPASDIEFHPTTLGKLSAVWVHAPQSTRHRLVLFFHGGGYTGGSWKSHADLLGRIAKAGRYDVLAIDYRLAPEHPFPAAMEDAMLSYQWLLEQGYTPEQIYVGGISAGGGMALSLLLKLACLNKKLPRAGICLCPWVDLALTTPSIKNDDGRDILKKEQLQKAANAYLQGHTPLDPFVSPLYADLKGLPPLLIQVGSRDLLLDENQQLAQKGYESGVAVTFQLFPDLIHAWQMFAAQLPEGQEAMEKVGAFIQSN